MYIPTRLGEDYRDYRPLAHHEIPGRRIAKSAIEQPTAEQSQRARDLDETHHLVARGHGVTFYSSARQCYLSFASSLGRFLFGQEDKA